METAQVLGRTATDAPHRAPATGSTRTVFTKSVAGAVLVFYVTMVVVLVLMRDDAQWDRLVYLLGGFEAIVFAAVGWIFGTTVARGAVQEAKAARDEAKVEASSARDEVEEQRTAVAEARKERDRSLVDAERGRALAAAIRSKRARSTRHGARPEAGGPRTGGSPGTDDLAELVDFADSLFTE